MLVIQCKLPFVVWVQGSQAWRRVLFLGHYAYILRELPDLGKGAHLDCGGVYFVSAK